MTKNKRRRNRIRLCRRKSPEGRDISPGVTPPENWRILPINQAVSGRIRQQKEEDGLRLLSAQDTVGR